ncbi:MAG: twin-arginine translocase TatA/TatE family subunit [Nitrospinaceae bacterium]|nr:twin-arginine translocase TatA/TatE family subunit [Nitrospinaceae bacterium]NIR57345.1 twin-arginine translocase TatA/TatE family subunit [Nitrospinaceae bacterium]NIS87797.1 twin-arginine translocase TatA/TatE family subunit [Nitrospinaceae bacterium]NIT84667.1 twin-arginine translocase TatA/TatE family subunit [Nitrospinaceae bacterium]NIU46846.1 twin-arginine translocase TatA/TatE family subunit [Nitrospinaceae bacterium]
MMGIGFPELMIILVIIMIIFGAGKLPEIGSAFGRSIKNFKTSMKEAEEAEQTAQVEEGTQPAGQLEENLSDEEKERLAREKAQAEGEAKDKAMKEKAEAFTASLPVTGSYDYAKDQADQAQKKAKA